VIAAGLCTNRRRGFRAGSVGQGGPIGIARVTGCKELLSSEHLVEHDAECPDIGAFVESVAARLLGRHVSSRAKDHTCLGHRQGQCREKIGLAEGADAAGSAALARPRPGSLTMPSGVTLMLAV
jgi:hypothetical protein